MYKQQRRHVKKETHARNPTTTKTPRETMNQHAVAKWGFPRSVTKAAEYARARTRYFGYMHDVHTRAKVHGGTTRKKRKRER